MEISFIYGQVFNKLCNKEFVCSDINNTLNFFNFCISEISSEHLSTLSLSIIFSFFKSVIILNNSSILSSVSL